MLLLLFGFAAGVIVSGALGALVIALHPRWQLTLTTLSWFVAGAFAAAIAASLLYTWTVADDNQRLHSAAAVLGYFATLLGATLLGGTVATFLGQKFFGPSA